MKMRHRKWIKQDRNGYEVFIRKIKKRIREVANEFYNGSTFTMALGRSRERAQQFFKDLEPIATACAIAAAKHLAATAQETDQPAAS